MKIIFVALLTIALAACNAKSPSIQIACKLYGKGISVSGTKDTFETIRQVAVKNTTFKKVGCKI